MCTLVPVGIILAIQVLESAKGGVSFTKQLEEKTRERTSSPKQTFPSNGFLPPADTKINLKLFNATVGSFLPDVDLVGVTVGHSGPLQLPEAETWGCKIIEIKHPDGSKDYLVQISFDSPGVEKEV